MENAFIGLIGFACLASSGFILFKLAAREGVPVRPWLEKDGAATAVSLAIIMVGSVGIGLLIKALTN